MTKEERWLAAIEEAKPLMRALAEIRKKYDIISLEINANAWHDMDEPYNSISVSEQATFLPEDDNELYNISLGGTDGKEDHLSTLTCGEVRD